MVILTEIDMIQISLCQNKTKVCFGGFNGISTLVGYLMPISVYTNKSIYDLYANRLAWFNGVSTIEGYLMPNPFLYI